MGSPHPALSFMEVLRTNERVLKKSEVKVPSSG